VAPGRVWHRVLQRVQVPGEEMIGLGDDDERPRLGQGQDQGPDRLLPPERVVCALDEEPRLAAAVEEGAVGDHGGGESEGEEGAHALVRHSHPQGHGGPEREPPQDQGQAGEAPLRLVEGGAHVVLLATSVIVHALAAAHPAEVEAQGGHALVLEGLGRAKDDLEVHDPALQGVGVADDRRRHRRALGPHEDRFQTPGGAGEVERLGLHRGRF